jgi:GTP-binding protein
LDDVVARLPPKRDDQPEGEPEKRLMRMAVLGKPNVGKSSFVNALLGEKRLIVDDLPGTTHDAIPVIIETADQPLTVVDTAGIRLNKKQDSRIEKLSVEQALLELQTCQVAVLIVDGEKGITHQDVTISRIIHEAFRPVVILINKWDIHPLAAEQARAERITKRELRLLDHAPVLFISAKTGMGMEKVLPTVNSVFEESCQEIPTSKVNAALQAALSKQNPPFRNGNQVKILYGYQRKGHPPAFEVFVRHAECMAPTYLRFLEDELRQTLGLERTPLHIALIEKTDDKEFMRPTFKRNFNPNLKIWKDRSKKKANKPVRKKGKK